MRPETAADCCLLQENVIKKRSITMRAAGEVFAFLEEEILLVEIASYLRQLRNKRECLELAMFHLQ